MLKLKPTTVVKLAGLLEKFGKDCHLSLRYHVIGEYYPREILTEEDAQALIHKINKGLSGLTQV